MVEIRVEPIERLPAQGAIDMAFEVTTVFEVTLPDAGLGGIQLVERPVDVPWVKDYDASEPPARWSERFAVGNWALFGAYIAGRRVGGAVVAFDTPGLHMLRGRRDLAVLWDLRVAPNHRRSGVGAALFRAAQDWARSRGCAALDVETQQINVPACRFYARMGCSLATVDRFAYPDLPGEVQLVWRLPLDSTVGPRRRRHEG